MSFRPQQSNDIPAHDTSSDLSSLKDHMHASCQLEFGQDCCTWALYIIVAMACSTNNNEVHRQALF